jgi:DMSO/TMAO reductase YedYZ heme-binding membrane subunit
MSVEWIVIRGSGVVAFAMLASSTIWGLLLATKVLGSWVKAKPLTWFHESLAVGALLATVVHMVTLSVHEYVDFTWGDILIPGRSEWRPSAVSFGIVAFYGAFVLSVSFYFKRFIGQHAWRAIHFGSYGVFVAAALHGILSGTDSSEPWMVGIYVGAVVASVLLLAIRFAQQYALAPARRQRGRPAVGGDEQPEINPASAEA